MHTRFQTVLESERQEAVTKLIADHRLLALPVVNAAGIMQGIVTIDDAMQAERETADEQLQRVGGMEALGGPYLTTSFGKMIRKRAGWLSVLFPGEMLTATAMGFFEQEIARAVVLALFIPLIISSGGNSGSQATTLVIRAMALGEVQLKNVSRVLRREVAAGLGLGSVLCIFGCRANFGVAGNLEVLWSAICARRFDGRREPDRSGSVRHDCRRDSTAAAAAMPDRSGDCFGAGRGHTR